ncbi:MAG: glycosyltransferase family 2 protein [Alloprevotella sp.]
MISVCIATYNGEAYIAAQLQSIATQLSPDDEIIISDDGSTDSTLRIIDSLDIPNIKVFHHKSTGHSAANFEHALKQSQGEFIFLSDQDDCWCSNKVKVMMCALKDHACVVSDCYITDQNLNIIHDSFYSTSGTHFTKWKNLLLRNGYLGCCMAFRRDVLRKALPFPKNVPMHDIWIGNIAAMSFDVTFLPDRLIYYRRHGQNATSTGGDSVSTLWQKITYRWNVIINLIRCL